MWFPADYLSRRAKFAFPPSPFLELLGIEGFCELNRKNSVLLTSGGRGVRCRGLRGGFGRDEYRDLILASGDCQRSKWRAGEPSFHKLPTLTGYPILIPPTEGKAITANANNTTHRRSVAGSASISPECCTDLASAEQSPGAKRSRWYQVT